MTRHIKRCITFKTNGIQGVRFLIVEHSVYNCFKDNTSFNMTSKIYLENHFKWFLKFWIDPEITILEEPIYVKSPCTSYQKKCRIQNQNFGLEFVLSNLNSEFTSCSLHATKVDISFLIFDVILLKSLPAPYFAFKRKNCKK